MTRTHAGNLPSRTLAATLALAMAVTTATTAPARAENDAAGAIFAASVIALIATAVVSSTRDGKRASPPVDQRKALPMDCRFDIRRGADRGTWYGRRCLVANFDHWPLLPDRCEQWVERPRRGREFIAYDTQCLARFGYRPDDRAPRPHR